MNISASFVSPRSDPHRLSLSLSLSLDKLASEQNNKKSEQSFLSLQNGQNDRTKEKKVTHRKDRDDLKKNLTLLKKNHQSHFEVLECIVLLSGAYVIKYNGFLLLKKGKDLRNTLLNNCFSLNYG